MILLESEEYGEGPFGQWRQQKVQSNGSVTQILDPAFYPGLPADLRTLIVGRVHEEWPPRSNQFHALAMALVYRPEPGQVWGTIKNYHGIEFWGPMAEFLVSAVGILRWDHWWLGIPGHVHFEGGTYDGRVLRVDQYAPTHYMVGDYESPGTYTEIPVRWSLD